MTIFSFCSLAARSTVFAHKAHNRNQRDAAPGEMSEWLRYVRVDIKAHLKATRMLSSVKIILSPDIMFIFAR